VYDNTIDPEGSDGISVSTGSFNNTVAYNVAYNNYDDGLDFSTQGGASGPGCNLYATITDNIAFNNGDGPGDGDGNGIKVSTNCGGGHLVANNIVFDNENSGFDQDKNVGYPQNFFYNNIAYNNGRNGLTMDAPSLPQEEDAILYNNIAANNANHDLGRSNDLAVDNSDYNLWADGNFISGMDAHSLSGDPMFIDSGLVVDTNFGIGWTIEEKLEHVRIQVKSYYSLASGSQLIDNGTYVAGYHCSTPGAHSGSNCREWYGNAPDIGAFESLGSGSDCVDSQLLLDFISHWKRGSISMPFLLDRILAWKSGEGCS